MIESGCAEAQIDFKPSRRGSALGGARSADDPGGRYSDPQRQRVGWTFWPLQIDVITMIVSTEVVCIRYFSVGSELFWSGTRSHRCLLRSRRVAQDYLSECVAQTLNALAALRAFAGWRSAQRASRINAQTVRGKSARARAGTTQ